MVQPRVWKFTKIFPGIYLIFYSLIEKLHLQITFCMVATLMVHPRIMKIHKNLPGIHLMIPQNFAVIGCMVFGLVQTNKHTFIFIYIEKLFSRLFFNRKSAQDLIICYANQKSSFISLIYHIGVSIVGLEELHSIDLSGITPKYYFHWQFNLSLGASLCSALLVCLT